MLADSIRYWQRQLETARTPQEREFACATLRCYQEQATRQLQYVSRVRPSPAMRIMMVLVFPLYVATQIMTVLVSLFFWGWFLIIAAVIVLFLFGN